MTLNFKSTSVVAVLAASTAIPAAAELKYENNSGGYVELYGQLNPAIISVDDGEETETRLLDNDLSNSRVGLRLLQPFGSNEFTFRFETGLGLPGSASADQFGTNGDGWTREDLRHVDFALKGDWGKFSAGQGSMVSDGAAEVDLSYVGTALYSFTNDENAGFFYRGTDGMLSDITVGDSSSNLDGSRRGRIRYDTPTVNGFSAGIAYGQNILSSSDDDDYVRHWPVQYENTFAGGVEFAAGLAYAVRDRDDNSGERKDTIGSASVLLPSWVQLYRRSRYARRRRGWRVRSQRTGTAKSPMKGTGYHGVKPASGSTILTVRILTRTGPAPRRGASRWCRRSTQSTPMPI